MKMTVHLLIQEQQPGVGALGSTKGPGWSPELGMVSAPHTGKDAWKWRQHLPARDWK